MRNPRAQDKRVMLCYIPESNHGHSRPGKCKCSLSLRGNSFVYQQHGHRSRLDDALYPIDDTLFRLLLNAGYSWKVQKHEEKENTYLVAQHKVSNLNHMAF